MKKALIFDLDGTLVDTLEDIGAAVNATLLHYNLPTHSLLEIKKMIGKGAKNLITRALPEDKREEGFVDEALAYYRAYYDSHLIVHTRVYNGLESVLRELKNKGVIMAVLSNKDDSHVVKIVNTLLPDIFETAMGFNPRFQRKPNPESLVAMMNGLGVSPEDTAYVGDLIVDAETAKNAGVTSVIVEWGFDTVDFDADFIISTPEELYTI